MTTQRQALEESARSLLEAIGRLDMPAIARCFAPDARLRTLLPGGLEQVEGSAAITEQFERWFASAERFEMTQSSASVVVDRFHVSYTARLARDRDSSALEVIEQHGFGDATPQGIETLDLVCSGFRPVVRTDQHVHVFDAGTMGCADGLAPEFRRRILAIPAGDLLQVVVQDPAAKEDLPPLARMLGHSIHSVDVLEDGRVQITVERAP